MNLIKGGAAALDLFENIGGGSGPDEGLGPLVVLRDVVFDGGDEFVHAAKDAATNPLVGEVAKEPLDHVQPGRRSGREVDMKALVALQPVEDFLVFVGGIVVTNNVDLFV